MDDNQQSSAESAIRNLIARLAHLADGNDVDEYMAQFTDDAVWIHPTLGTRTGWDDILAGARERRAAAGQGEGSHARHIITTQWVRLEGADEAFSQTYWILLLASSPPEVLHTGRYDDTVRHTPDGWKLARRDIVLDVN